MNSTPEKRAALKKLVMEAANESREGYPAWLHPDSPFESTRPQTAWIDDLVTALRTTDALHILHDMLEELD